MDFFDYYTGDKNVISGFFEESNGMLETYEADYDLVLEMNECCPHKVWTVVECGGELIIMPGLHRINRVHYFVSEEEWEDPYEEYKFNDVCLLRF